MEDRIFTSHPSVNLMLLSTTVFGSIIANITASQIASVFTILLAVFGMVNYYYSVKKSRAELRKAELEIKNLENQNNKNG